MPWSLFSLESRIDMTLPERFRRYRAQNPPDLAYYLARHKHVENSGYVVPQFLIFAYIGRIF